MKEYMKKLTKYLFWAFGIAWILQIIAGVLFQKGNSIAYSMLNAFAGVPILFMNPAYADKLLLGPLMIGVIGGLPLILVAGVICKLEMRR